MLCWRTLSRIQSASQLSQVRKLSTSKSLYAQVVTPQVTTTNTTNFEKHWKAERYLSLALLGVLPAAAIVSHPFMDYAVATSLVVHVHWGLEAIVTDYVRPSIFGPVIPKASIGLVYVLSILTLSGLFVFNWTDIGISQACRMLAKI